jgi:hypothetical protein
MPVMIDILLNEHPFYESLLSRSSGQRLGEGDVSVASPEDLLLLKVLASRPQDVADAAKPVEAHGASLDRGYLQRWAAELGLEVEIERLLATVPSDA